MDFSINDHLVNTVHFRPLIKDSFNELGPEAFNSGYTNYSIIENDLSLEILPTLTTYIKGYLESAKVSIEKEII